MSGPFLLGLTGSIGMGKSTTLAMFADHGLEVWDADDAVHRLYAPGGGAAQSVARVCPAAVGNDGVDREVLKRWIAEDDSALGQLEAVVHPLVADDRRSFVSMARSDIVVLDIPLLYETGNVKDFDAVAVVSAPANVQKQRVLARPGMTEDLFASILARQMSDAEKRTRADFVIPTKTLDGAQQAVEDIISQIRGALADA